MRLKPAISAEQAYHYLSLNAVLVWGVTDAAGLEPHLQSIAKAMAVVGGLDIPDAVEPLFGEDSASEDMP